MATDWFRRSTWTLEDKEDFKARLSRARPHSRSQYVRIQAHHLAEAALFANAIMLLDRLFAEYPDRLQLAPAHQLRGECLMNLGFIDSALDAYRDAIDAQRAFPNVQTMASLEFGFAIVKLQRQELYDEALSLPVRLVRCVADTALVRARALCDVSCVIATAAPGTSSATTPQLSISIQSYRRKREDDLPRHNRSGITKCSQCAVGASHA